MPLLDARVHQGYKVTKIKDVCDALKSINVAVDEDEMVHICLGGLAQKYGAIQTTICRREKPLPLFYLQSMLLVVEDHVGALTSTHTNNKMLYTDAD